MSLAQTTVLKLYHTVIDDVITGVRDHFLDEGVDEQVLQELKQVWTNKLMASRAVELTPDVSEPQVPPSALSNSQKSNSKAKARQAAASNAENASSKANITGTTPTPAPPAAVIGLDPNKIVPIQITLPAMPGVQNSEQRVLTISVPASALQENQLHQVITGPIIQSIMPLPPQVASSVLQQHVNAALQNSSINSIHVQKQLDGAADTSDEDGSDISDDHLDNDDDNDDLDKSDEENDEGGAEEEPLNSEDDVTDEDSSELFETDNVVVCQYDKITRSRNKWKFYLKDGIMNIGGKDYVFQKSNGDAEW